MLFITVELSYTFVFSQDTTDLSQNLCYYMYQEFNQFRSPRRDVASLPESMYSGCEGCNNQICGLWKQSVPEWNDPFGCVVIHVAGNINFHGLASSTNLLSSISFALGEWERDTKTHPAPYQ